MKNKKLQNDSWQYDPIAKLFHWILAILLITLIIVGFYMVSIEKMPYSDWYFNLHKSLGITAALLIVFRFTWRIYHLPPTRDLNIPFWQVIAARIVHWLLYACMILMPLTGFLGASFDNQLYFYGLTIPNWVRKDKSLTDLFLTTHGYIAWILVTLIVMHILAALVHLIVYKDNLFKRMWF